MPLLRVVQLGGDRRHEIVSGGREESAASKGEKMVIQSACDAGLWIRGNREEDMGEGRWNPCKVVASCRYRSLWTSSLSLSILLASTTPYHARTRNSTRLGTRTHPRPCPALAPPLPKSPFLCKKVGAALFSSPMFWMLALFSIKGLGALFSPCWADETTPEVIRTLWNPV